MRINKELAAIRAELGHVGQKRDREKIYLNTQKFLGMDDLDKVLGHTVFGLEYGQMIEVSGWECLAGETLIDTPRNMEIHPQGIPIKDLVGKTPWVYGYDQSLGRIVLRKASRVWKVGRRKVFKVSFSVSKNSVRVYGKQPEYILATESHPFMLRVRSQHRSKFSPAYDWESEGYRCVKDLKPGDRIMPFFRKRTNESFVVHLNNGEDKTEHRFILSEIHGDHDPEVWDGHHKDEHPMNNEVENLEWKTASQHMSDHLRDRNLAGLQGWQKTGVHPRGMLGKHHTKKGRTAISNGLLRRSAALNHKVTKVEFHGYEDVYDMEVPGINNFVANGIVVHNSQGKSAIMMSLAALAQSDGAHVIWGDLENSFKPDWAIQRGFIKCATCSAKQPAMATCKDCEGDGLNWDRITLIQPYVGKFGKEKVTRLASAQELCTEMERAMKSPRKGCDRFFVVLDSIAALETEEEQRAGLKDSNMKSRMSLPVFIGRMLRRWQGIGATQDAMIVLVNQLRQGPAKFGDGTYTTGGNGPRFYSHVRVRVTRVLGSKLIEKGKVVGIKGIIINKKNKQGGEEGSKVGFKIWFKKNIEFLPAKDVEAKKEDAE